ncbi:hypothetical protein [Streptomyces lydicus]|uniref:hypothetical protein n=1 Tax=Streptomyces lydicus TaxID=47763 RepID=UPI00101250B1|nr:hypothetical protein [Streptomyces lydicus]MCZ1012016.1 hypothetical protein [Streptomyces lydicus]
MFLTTVLTAIAWTTAGAAPVAAAAIEYLSKRRLTSRKVALIAVLHATSATMFLALMTRAFADNDKLIALVTAIIAASQLGLAVIELIRLRRMRDQRSAQRKQPARRETLDRP